MMITKILLTLPPTLNHFCTAWESTAPDQRPLINLTSRLTAEEARLNHQGTQAEVNGLLSKGQGAHGGALAARGGKEKVKKKPGGEKESGRYKKGECNFCHNQGHWEHECRVKLKFLLKKYDDE